MSYKIDSKCRSLSILKIYIAFSKAVWNLKDDNTVAILPTIPLSLCALLLTLVSSTLIHWMSKARVLKRFSPACYGFSWVFSDCRCISMHVHCLNLESQVLFWKFCFESFVLKVLFWKFCHLYYTHYTRVCVSF